MQLNIQPSQTTTPIVSHRDFPETPYRPGFSTVDIKLGDNEVTIFLPYMGRLNYTTEETK